MSRHSRRQSSASLVRAVLRVGVATTALALGAGGQPIAAVRLAIASMNPVSATGVPRSLPRGHRGVAGDVGMDSQGAQNPKTALDRVVSAKGGLQRLRSIRSIVMSGTSTVVGAKPVVAHIRNYIAYPDRFRQDAQLPGGTVTQVWAQGESWMQDAGGVHDVPPASRDNLAATVSRDIVALLLAAVDGKAPIAMGDAPPPQPQAPSPVLDTLRIGSGAGQVDLFVDRATAQIAGRRYVVAQPGAVGKIPTEEWYSDYRVVDGLHVAFTTVVRRGAATIMELRLSEFQLNVPIAGDTFARPVK